jgi:hypothetical protein
MTGHLRHSPLGVICPYWEAMARAVIVWFSSLDRGEQGSLWYLTLVS